MPSYVIIWENNTPGHKRVPDAHYWEGHAAINIGSKLPPGATHWNSYVSWFPKDDLLVSELPSHLFSSGQAGKSTSFMHDVYFEGYLPDHIVKLSSDPDKEAKMRAEWNTINQSQGGASFHMLRSNCSTIVSRVMQAGGYYAFKWAIDNNLFWTPADVHRLALAAGGESMSWEDFVEVLKVSGILPQHLVKKYGGQCKKARDARLCTTGAPCKFGN